MPWNAHLTLDYSLERGRTVARHRHEGPLRILQSLYPEGDDVCHNVLVHPPGGLVGGDTLELQIKAHAASHGLLTTPGATRFYRSEGDEALQRVHLHGAADSRLEWLPLETICYSGCLAYNHLTVELDPGAELIGWDITALGLPTAGQPFERGRLRQHLEMPGVWLVRGTLEAQDDRLLNGPVGLAGYRCMATLFFLSGTALPRLVREALLEIARAALGAHPLAGTAGVTSPNSQVVVVRALAPLVEPAMDLLRQVRGHWRTQCWAKTTQNPRIWSM